MKLRLIILTILLLLNCFSSWSEETDSIVPFTGKIQETETAKVTLPIDIIRNANIKLNERLVLIDILKYKDTQLKYYKEVNDIQNNNIDNMNKQLDDKEKELQKYKTNNLIFKTIVAVELGVIITLLVCSTCN